MDELRRQDAEERDAFKLQIEDMQEKCEERKGIVEEENNKFTEFKRQIALNSINSRSGKPIAQRVS